MIADDLFAGAGGWDLAAETLGITARGIENAAAARATRDAAGLVTIHDDVWTYVPDRRAAGSIASPPCPTFSNAGSGSGRRALRHVLDLVPQVPDLTLDELRTAAEAVDEDPRTALVLAPFWFMLHGGYSWAAWEQVPGALPVWEACAAVARRHGWHVWTGILTSERYGVPQTRRRAVFIASRARPVGEPVATHSRYHNRSPERLDLGLPRWVSMADALGYGAGVKGTHMGEVVRPNGCVRAIDEPAPTVVGAMDNGNYRFVGPSWTPDPERINNQSGTLFNVEEQVQQPASTIAGRDLVPFRGANANRFNGASKSRNDGIRVSVQEAGVLQTFPVDFPWQGNKGEQYLQAGNAVPPLLARAVLSVAIGAAVTPTDDPQLALFEEAGR